MVPFRGSELQLRHKNNRREAPTSKSRESRPPLTPFAHAVAVVVAVAFEFGS
jgi:hypothetical protein